jgi:hypothetical protein
MDDGHYAGKIETIFPTDPKRRAGILNQKFASIKDDD